MTHLLGHLPLSVEELDPLIADRRRLWDRMIKPNQPSLHRTLAVALAFEPVDEIFRSAHAVPLFALALATLCDSPEDLVELKAQVRDRRTE